MVKLINEIVFILTMIVIVIVMIPPPGLPDRPEEGLSDPPSD